MKFYWALIIFMALMPTLASSCEPKTFWKTPKKGANIMNRTVSLKDIKADKAYGIEFIRLAPDKFLTKERDFLMGDADNYRQLIKEDLKTLKTVLDFCLAENMPVVLTFLSLPGSRWKQNNQDKDDLRIWSDATFQKQAAQFWQDLALEIKDYPILVGYNILNEPHPERHYNVDPQAILYKEHQSEVQATLFTFYQTVIKAIRTVDKTTPIILDSSSYADPNAFEHFKPQKDPYVLYAFHMYEPYAYTHHASNGGKWHYPGNIQGQYWDKKALEDYLKVISRFQEKHGIASDKIWVGEFGGYRLSQGLEYYFKHLTNIFTEKKWHFAFYAFREDTWDGMDYELGMKKYPKDSALRSPNVEPFKTLKALYHP